MPALSPTRGNHVNLSVTDLERSVEWYCQVFGLVVAADEKKVPPATDQPLRYRSLIDPTTFSYVIGLIEHAERSGDRFDERRTGLDHLAFHVDEPEHLEEWAGHLDALGVEHSGIKSLSYASAITFRDPDNIQLELHYPNIEFWTPHFIAAAEQTAKDSA